MARAPTPDRTPLPDTQDLAYTGLAPGKAYLGTPSVVEGLVRELMAEVTTARADQAEGKLATLKERLEPAADRFQRVFYGQDAAYLGSAWNTPRQLGRALVEDNGIGGSADDAVKRLATRIMADTARALADYEADRTDEAGMRSFVDQAVEVYTNVLRGIGVVQEADDADPAPADSEAAGEADPAEE